MVSNFYDFSIYVKQYNCFHDVTLLDNLKRVNVLIGRNNSGKSSVLDIIEKITKGEYKDTSFEIYNEVFLTRETLEEKEDAFNADSRSSNTSDFLDFVINFTNCLVRIGDPDNPRIVSVKDNSGKTLSGWHWFLDQCVDPSSLGFKGKIFKRIFAERDIIPEFANKSDPVIEGNGNGVTNAVESYLNSSELSENSEEIIKNKLLPALNAVFSQDGCFISISCKKHKNDKWEIYFEEDHKKPIALSKSGSGFKTVIIVLAFLILIPEIEKKSLSNYVFGFEELENNLHPALLRRLNNYIYKLSIEENFIYFMTTHSNVMIDQFSNQKDAQLVNITQTDGKSSCRTVETFTHNHSVLNDLEVQASDLLQANGVIWVEGPSDVIFINKWLEIYSNENNKKQFVQGRDFEFHMFGGTLLDSLSLIKSDGKGEEEYKKLVSMFSFSRNAYVVIDSDAVKTSDGEVIDKSNFQKAKKYIKAQFDSLITENANLGLWYKEGDTEIRTMENYLDKKSLKLIETHNWTKKVAAQKITESWGDNKKLEDFPNNLENEISLLYGMIKTWNS